MLHPGHVSLLNQASTRGRPTRRRPELRPLGAPPEGRQPPGAERRRARHGAELTEGGGCRGDLRGRHAARADHGARAGRAGQGRGLHGARPSSGPTSCCAAAARWCSRNCCRHTAPARPSAASPRAARRESPRPGRGAVILDRDGTIVVDRGYLDDPAQLCFLPGAAEGLRLWHDAGHPLVIVSNQSGIGRGLLSLERAPRDQCAAAADDARPPGRASRGIYFCPHRPEEGCACRKPEPQLLLEAAAELLASSRGAGGGDRRQEQRHRARPPCAARVTLLVSAGRPRQPMGSPPEPDYVVANLLEAAQHHRASLTRRASAAAPAARI